MTYMIPRENGEVVLGVTFVSIIYLSLFIYFRLNLLIEFIIGL